MLATTETYRSILASNNYETEVKVVIDGVTYDESWISRLEIDSGVFSDDELTIGCAYNSSVSLELYNETLSVQGISDLIPRGAEIRVYERLVGTVDDYTESAIVGLPTTIVGEGHAVVGTAFKRNAVKDTWMLQGIFFVDTRDATSWTGTLAIEGIDRMALAGAEHPGTKENWPKSAYATVAEIANIIGVQLDSRTVKLLKSKNYEIKWPTAYTMRETLGYIAAMYCGNFIITKEGKLFLLQVKSLPPEESYLITYAGDGIEIGGYLISV